MILNIKKIVTILFIFQLVSCVSLPNTSDSSKGLLVIPLGQENDEHLEFFGEYKITFQSLDNDTSFSRRVNPKGKYALVYLEPGNYKISKVNFIYKSGKHGTIKQLSIKFGIEHGKVSILSKRFITKIYSNDYGGHTMNKSFINTSNEYKNEIIDNISNLGNFEMWSFL